MKVLIYRNKSKDADGKITEKLTSYLDLSLIEYEIISVEDLNSKKTADAIFVLGGDGTLLLLNEFANRNNIPLIGVNIGKLGFLSEFESYEIEDAVKLFSQNQLKVDERIALEVNYNGKTYLGVNDIYVQRLFSKDIDSILATVKIKADGDEILTTKGDGVIVSTPTGSTAYSLSSGGSILTPNVDAVIITPISAHSLSQRPIIYSSKGKFDFSISGEVCVGLFVDGKFIAELVDGNSFSVKVADTKTVFLRKKDFNFFNRLNLKLKGDTGA